MILIMRICGQFLIVWRGPYTRSVMQKKFSHIQPVNNQHLSCIQFVESTLRTKHSIAICTIASSSHNRRRCRRHTRRWQHTKLSPKQCLNMPLRPPSAIASTFIHSVIHSFVHAQAHTHTVLYDTQTAKTESFAVVANCIMYFGNSNWRPTLCNASPHTPVVRCVWRAYSSSSWCMPRWWRRRRRNMQCDGSPPLPFVVVLHTSI